MKTMTAAQIKAFEFFFTRQKNGVAQGEVPRQRVIKAMIEKGFIKADYSTTQTGTLAYFNSI